MVAGTVRPLCGSAPPPPSSRVRPRPRYTHCRPRAVQRNHSGTLGRHDHKTQRIFAIWQYTRNTISRVLRHVRSFSLLNIGLEISLLYRCKDARWSEKTTFSLFIASRWRVAGTPTTGAVNFVNWEKWPFCLCEVELKPATWDVYRHGFTDTCIKIEWERISPPPPPPSPSRTGLGHVEERNVRISQVYGASECPPADLEGRVGGENRRGLLVFERPLPTHPHLNKDRSGVCYTAWKGGGGGLGDEMPKKRMSFMAGFNSATQNVASNLIVVQEFSSIYEKTGIGTCLLLLDAWQTRQI